MSVVCYVNVLLRLIPVKRAVGVAQPWVEPCAVLLLVEVTSFLVVKRGEAANTKVWRCKKRILKAQTAESFEAELSLNIDAMSPNSHSLVFIHLHVRTGLRSVRLYELVSHMIITNITTVISLKLCVSN